jgi:hypothetical protein
MLFFKSKSQPADFFKKSKRAIRKPPVAQMASERRFTDMSFRRLTSANIVKIEAPYPAA